MITIYSGLIDSGSTEVPAITVALLVFFLFVQFAGFERATR